MRLTISIEEDLYRVAKSMAKAEDTSMSKAVNRLIRRGLEESQKPPSQPGGKKQASSFPVSSHCRPMSEQEVYELDVVEDMAKWNGS